MLLVLLLAAQTAVASDASEDVGRVKSINIRAEGVEPQNLKVARSYAYCLSRVRFPTKGEYAAKRRKCDRSLPKKQSDEVAKLVLQLRQIGRENFGSEASLTVAEGINAPNN